MNSIKFPKMFNTNNTQVWKPTEYLEATKQNTLLLLNTERGGILGDPYFGIILKQYLFDQNSAVLRDALIDMIYTQVALFIPQLKIERKNISITKSREKGKIECTIRGINQIDYQQNTYNLILYQDADM